MKNIAEKFVEKKNSAFGGKWLLFCNNLDAHCWDGVLELFDSYKVLIVFQVALMLFIIF